MSPRETLNHLRNARIVAENVSGADYIAQEFKRGEPGFVMSRSELCEFNVCPRRWLNGYREEGSKETAWGSLVDCLLMTPDQASKQFAVVPETYPSKGKSKPWNWNANFCKDWRKEHSGATPVSQRDFQSAEAAVFRLKSDADISEYLKCSKKQVLVVAEYHDRATGIIVPIKCLIDLVPDKDHERYGKGLADFKTAMSAKQKAWRRHVYKYNYHIQGVIYLDAYVAATGEDRCEFRHIVQENFSPFEPAKRILSTEFAELGRSTYVSALRRYCRCLATGFWPGYDDEARESINGWQITQPEPWMVLEPSEFVERQISDQKPEPEDEQFIGSN